MKSSEQKATHYVKRFVIYTYEKEISFEGFLYKNNVVSHMTYNVEQYQKTEFAGCIYLRANLMQSKYLISFRYKRKPLTGPVISHRHALQNTRPWLIPGTSYYNAEFKFLE